MSLQPGCVGPFLLLAIGARCADGNKLSRPASCCCWKAGRPQQALGVPGVGTQQGCLQHCPSQHSRGGLGCSCWGCSTHPERPSVLSSICHVPCPAFISCSLSSSSSHTPPPGEHQPLLRSWSLQEASRRSPEEEQQFPVTPNVPRAQIPTRTRFLWRTIH